MSDIASSSMSVDLRSRCAIKPLLPLGTVATRDPNELLDGELSVLVADDLTFSEVTAALDEPRIAGVAIGPGRYPDHARKMIQESGRFLAVCEAGTETIRPGERYQVDEEGLLNLDELPLRVSAICSHLTTEYLRRYRSFNVSHLGYYRIKFALFEILARDRSLARDATRLEEILTGKLATLAGQGWSSIRLVLSDPTTSELQELGVDAPDEDNPELGVRGPRSPERWEPELRAVGALARSVPECEVLVSVPFVSTAAEYRDVIVMAKQAELPANVRFGLTLEVPRLIDELALLGPDLLPAFVALGTSDLLSLYNGVDRNNTNIVLEPTAQANVSLVERVAKIAANLNLPFFVCGDVRRDRQIAQRLIEIGATELIAGASPHEIARVNRIAARGVPRMAKGTDRCHHL